MIDNTNIGGQPNYQDVSVNLPTTNIPFSNIIGGATINQTPAFANAPLADYSTPTKLPDIPAPVIAEQPKVEKKEDFNSEKLVKELQAKSEKDAKLKTLGIDTGAKILRTPNQKIDLGGKDVNSIFTHKDLHSGEKLNRYDEYFAMGNTEEILAKRQGATEKWINGVAKNFLKTANYITDGTAGFVYGLGSAISQGSLNAMYNNDFSKMLDDANARLDTSLANYYTEEEKNMNFLQKMTTANYWANDFLGGMAFLTATIGSEALWAMATGGSSLATTMPRIALKASAGALGKIAGKQTARAYAKNILKVIKKYEKAGLYGKASGFANDLRFLATSAGFEAGFEARSSIQESLESFKMSHEITNGKPPSAEEYRAFMTDAVDLSNGVFSANMALVGGSNMLQLGSYFGVGTGLSKTLSKSVGKAFGLGFTKTFDDAGNVVFTALNPKRSQKIIANTYNFLKAPIIEGVIEEGGQSVISNTSKRWLASRYNPDALNENYSLMQSAYDSFAHTYTSKEGWNEIWTGMLIGLVGQGKAKGAMGKWNAFGLNEFSQDVQANQQRVDNLNATYNKMTDANKRLIDRLVKTNQFNTFIDSAKRNADKGNLTTASIDWNTAQFTKLLIEDSADLLDESADTFEGALNAVDTAELAKEYGISEGQVEKYKEALVEDYKKNIETYKRAKSIAETLAPMAKGKGIAQNDFTQELALNIYLGINSDGRAKEIADNIAQMTGKGGIADALNLYSRLSRRQRNRVNRIKKLEDDIVKLENEFTNLQNSFTETSLDKTNRIDANTKVSDKASQVEVQRNKKQQELVKKRQELEVLKNDLADRYVPTGRFSGLSIFGDQSQEEVSEDAIVESVREVEGLNKYLEVLRKEDPKLAENLELQLEEYVNSVKAFRDFNLVYEKMTDSKYMNEYKGILNVFRNIGTQTEDDAVENPYLDTTNAEIASYIEANKDDLTESQIFTLNTLSRMSSSRKIDLSVFSDNRVYEPVSDKDYADFQSNGNISQRAKDGITEALFYHRDLSERQLEIYTNSIQEIDDIVNQRRKRDGDFLRDLIIHNAVPIRTYDETSLSGKLRNIVEGIRRNKKILQDVDFESIEKPTDADYLEYEKLAKAKRLGAKRQARFDELKEKINNWGKAEGTTSLVDGVSVNLSDFIDQIISLESIEENSDEVSTRLASLDNLFSFDLRDANRNGYHSNLQTFENAMVSQDSNGNYIVSNISAGALITAMNLNRGNVSPIVFLRRGKRDNIVNSVNGVYSLDNSNLKPNDKIIIQTPIGDVIELTVAERGRLVIDADTSQILQQQSDIRIAPNNVLPTNYQTLFREVNDNGVQRLVPIATDFVFPNGEKMNTEAIFDLDKGDKLSVEVDINDSYNAKLIDKYNKAKNEEAKQKALKELTNNLHVFIRDNNGNLVGTMKVIPNFMSVSATLDAKFNTLVGIREHLAKEFLDGYFENNQKSSIEVPVSKIYAGHPNLSIVSNNGVFEIERILFDDESVKQIEDIGYVQNGDVVLSRNTDDYITDFISGLPKTTNERTPIVIFRYGGKKIAYPVEVPIQNSDYVTQVSSILQDTALDVSSKIEEVNKIVVESGIGLSEFGLHYGNINEMTKIDSLLDELSKVNKFADVSFWADPSVDFSSALIGGGATINVDITNKPFHSPKIALDFLNKELRDSIGRTQQVSSNDQQVDEDLDSLINQITQEQNRPCI